MPARDDPPLLLIGALAARCGKSVHAIRWYEAQGLVPGVARDAGGRRRYREQHVAWLELMERLRTTGMSIAEMRRYTELVTQGRKSLAARRDMLAAHRADVLATISRWQEALTALDQKLDFYDDWIATGHRPARDPLKPLNPGIKP
ncbi:MerR family transcriptional regulator [Pelomonas sp. Root1237]|uniref:MerR family transcriptional regulator n=1 Tax=Pelomonas sp. Root1237 TaxID=1736434 RepID=UPI0006FCF5F9|nr:MerR family transcriptional regulator [Pelomonas sp. Root1237]KQV96018.1 MerR family transcriptional regulator [Pelomonas sp. Root1237]